MGRAFEDVKILINFCVSASWREKNWIIFNDKWCLTKNISQILKYYFLKRKKTLHLQSRTKRVWFGTIAQLVEQRTENPCVAGSIPAGTTRIGTSALAGVSLFKSHSSLIFKRSSLYLLFDKYMCLC